MKKKKPDYGIFCEIYGKTIRNIVLEFALCENNCDWAVGSMAEYLNVSRPMAYKFVKEFEKKKWIKKSRIISGTQLYILNKKNRRVKLLLKAFKDCLKLVMKEAQEKYCKKSSASCNSGASVGLASARSL